MEKQKAHMQTQPHTEQIRSLKHTHKQAHMHSSRIKSLKKQMFPLQLLFLIILFSIDKGQHITLTVPWQHFTLYKMSEPDLLLISMQPLLGC